MGVSRKSNWTEAELLHIYNKTDGFCRHCKKQLVFKNRMKGQRGAWHVDHGRSLHNNGTNHIRNMWALCTEHNIDKSITNGTKYDSQFKHATFKGNMINAINRYVIGDLYWTNGIKNNERRIKK